MPSTNNTSHMGISFLSLPRELRDTIYFYYVIELNGYHYHYESSKFRTCDGRHIDLALMYTCTSVAKEMHQLALNNNVLHFSTVDTEPEKAYRFDTILQPMESNRIFYTLGMLRKPEFRHYLSADLVARVVLKFPQFESLFHQPYYLNPKATFLHEEGKGSSWGEANSTYCSFQKYMIELLSSESDFMEKLVNYYEDHQRVRDEIAESDAIFNRLYGSADLDEDEEDEDGNSEEEEEEEEEEESEEQVNENERLKFRSKLQEGLDKASFLRSPLLLSGLKPWAIPRDEELLRFSTNLVIYDTHNKMSECIRWRFSAAAVAIHFFESASQSVRLGVRKFVLHENKRSVAKSECHMLGLVPFCSQNPQLQIQRRLNVWGNFSTATADSDASRFASLIAEGAYASHNQKYTIDIGENYNRDLCSVCQCHACRIFLASL